MHEFINSETIENLININEQNKLDLFDITIK